MNGYTICSGIINDKLNGPNIVARPLKVDDYMEVGYILPNGIKPTTLTNEYIKLLKGITAQEKKKQWPQAQQVFLYKENLK